MTLIKKSFFQLNIPDIRTVDENSLQITNLSMNLFQLSQLGDLAVAAIPNTSMLR